MRNKSGLPLNKKLNNQNIKKNTIENRNFSANMGTETLHVVAG
jgi:hypothetical protein